MARTPEQKAKNAADQRERRKRWTPEQRQRNREAQARYRQRNLEKCRAWNRESQARLRATDPTYAESKRLYAIEWRKRNPDYAKEYAAEHRERRRAARIEKMYGLSADEHARLLADGCAICGSHEKLVVDHCHTSGDVRGALCDTHNVGLGRFGDDPALLAKAFVYLTGGDELSEWLDRR